MLNLLAKIRCYFWMFNDGEGQKLLSYNRSRVGWVYLVCLLVFNSCVVFRFVGPVFNVCPKRDYAAEYFHLRLCFASFSVKKISNNTFSMTSHCSPSPLHVYITHSVWIHSTWGSYTVSVEVLCPFPLSSSYVASCFSVCVLCLSAPVFFSTQCSNNVTFQTLVTGKRKHKYFRKLSKTLKLMFLFMRKID